MITTDYCLTMALYNRWQNRSLITAANGLSGEDLWQDRGAFFGSIAATFNHLFWDDQLWLARFAGDEKPETHLPVSLIEPRDWGEFQNRRVAIDSQLIRWAEGLTASDLLGELAWHPGGIGPRMVRPRWLCITHLFNHQTHHRGQIHGMLTAAGVHPEATDLPVLPEI